MKETFFKEAQRLETSEGVVDFFFDYVRFASGGPSNTTHGWHMISAGLGKIFYDESRNY